MARITYADKSNRKTVSVPAVNTFSADDANEVKESVNALYDGAGTSTVSEVNLTAAQIADLHNTPIEAIAAPGAGKVINVLSYFYMFNYGTAAFNGVTLRFDQNGNTYGIDSISRTADYQVVDNSASFDNGNGTLVNQAVNIDSSGDAGGTGDSTIDIYITYVEITL